MEFKQQNISLDRIASRISLDSVTNPGVLQDPECVLAALLGRLVDGADHGPDSQGHLGVNLVPGVNRST